MATDCRFRGSRAKSSQALLTTFSWGSGYFPRDGRFQLVIFFTLTSQNISPGGWEEGTWRQGKQREDRRAQETTHIVEVLESAPLPHPGTHSGNHSSFCLGKGCGYLLSGEDFTTSGGSSETSQTRIGCNLKYASFLIARRVLINLPARIRDCFTMRSSTIYFLKTA